MNHTYFMRRALDLARQGSGRVYPNPMVGAVLVKKGRIIGEGFHENFGDAHAEVNAIRTAKDSLTGASLYVTLEPCAHFGKTPPCVDLILEKGIRHVIVAASDPNPLVSGRGLRLLKKRGVRITTGVLTSEAKSLNSVFYRWIRDKRPYVVIKIAQSLDGKIATSSGRSRWITGPRARAFGHGLRSGSDAILVGVNTVLKDNPRLDVRFGKMKRQARDPVKIVMDSRLRTPLRARLFSKTSRERVILAVTKKAPASRIALFRKKADVWVLKERNGRVDLGALLKKLGQKGIARLLVEGGGEVIGSFFRERRVDEIYSFVAPMIIGGRRAPTSVGGEGAFSLADAPVLKSFHTERIGRDLLIRGTF